MLSCHAQFLPEPLFLASKRRVVQCQSTLNYIFQRNQTHTQLLRVIPWNLSLVQKSEWQKLVLHPISNQLQTPKTVALWQSLTFLNPSYNFTPQIRVLSGKASCRHLVLMAALKSKHKPPKAHTETCWVIFSGPIYLFIIFYFGRENSPLCFEPY